MSQGRYELIEIIGTSPKLWKKANGATESASLDVSIADYGPKTTTFDT